ncbi:MAG: alpha/beta hydrolase [Firmicutes bacterium]|nr:alpha/beta hydrolase [Bacillota bacterium]
MLKRLALFIASSVLGVALASAPAWAAGPTAIALHPAHLLPIPKPPTWNKGLIGVRERLVYEMAGRQPLTLFLFHPAKPSILPRPVVVYIHGGALRFGSAMITNANTPHNRLLVAVERKLIEQGYDFVSVNYQLAPLHPWPIPLDDVKHAVMYLLVNARMLGINPDRLAVMGDSAGGELSSFVGLTLKEGPHGAPVVKAVVDLFGPTDRKTFAIQWRKRHGLKPNPVYGVYTWKRVKRESVVTYVHPKAPPFLIIQGTRDHIVPPQQSHLLKVKLKEAGDPVKEILVHHAGHELVPVGGHIHPGIPYLAEQIDRFLISHLGGTQPLSVPAKPLMIPEP